jgi:glycosyltransferase involved in cell wall biosynthesis
VNAPFEMTDYADVVVPVRAERLVVTCFDLIPLRFDDVYLADRGQRARYLTRLSMLNAADAVVADSQSAADDLVELAGVSADRITVIGAGVGSGFVPPTASLAERLAELRRLLPSLRARYVLVPTGIDWRKNVEGAIGAFGRLPEPVRRRHQLVLACRLDDAQRAWIEQLAVAAGIDDRVVVTGHLPDHALVPLYQTAELVLFPSFYEGFGLPVLEARRCGARVICSNTSSLPEVLPDPRALFDPHDPAEVVALLHAALTDPEYAAVLDDVPDPGCSWSIAAARVVDVYAGLAAAGPSSPLAPIAATAPPRLGIVTVLPPARSGVADHSERLIDALVGFDDVDVVTYVGGSPGRPDAATVRPLAALATDWAAGRLDAVVYCVGNNRLHRDALTQVQLVPGHVFLHDVRLDWLAEPGRPDPAAVAVGAALSVLVQSAHAGALVRDIHAVDATDIGPHPCQVVADATPIVDDGSLPWVVSAGIAHEIKQSDVVAAAMAGLVASGEARAALVGAGGERFVAEGDGVIVTGEVGSDDFDRWLRRAAVLVQLRRSSNGESSGVVAHAMARGVPLIVSDIGAMAELPPDVALRLPVAAAPDEVAAAVRTLLADPERRAAMRRAGLEFAARETPTAQARRLVEAVFGRPV